MKNKATRELAGMLLISIHEARLLEAQLRLRQGKNYRKKLTDDQIADASLDLYVIINADPNAAEKLAQDFKIPYFDESR